MDETGLFKELLSFFEKGQISALLVIIMAVLVLTQLLKVTLLRVLHQKASVEFIHVVSLLSAIAFGWFLWPSASISHKVLAMVLGWGGAAFIATYGLRLTAEFFPRIHRVLQMDRRRGGIPPEGGGERSTDKTPAAP